jgi:dipeptidase
LGFIPEAASTYALYESSYPLMNEHGLAFGESTTEAKGILANAQVGRKDPRTNNTENGTALFPISQLMQVALERCASARCAIETMANISEVYGFAGEAFGASEMVSIIDKHEAWIFEITGGGPFKKVGDLGSLWVAQRVPDDHVAVVANYMIIQKIDPEDTENFMVSPNLFPRLKELGLYDGPVSDFIWQEVMGGTLQNLEMYDLLRRWRIYSRVAPSLNMQPTHKISEMPFSVKPDFPVSELDVMNLFRDHYESTEFDMTQGVLAGPNGNPNYELTGRDMQNVKGQIPRAMSLMRTAYTSIVVADEFPKVWFGVDAPASSVFVPLWADALSNGTMSRRFMIGKQQEFDRESAHWAFNFVSNWMSYVNYRNISQEYVFPKRDALQERVIEQVESVENKLIGD